MLPPFLGAFANPSSLFVQQHLLPLLYQSPAVTSLVRPRSCKMKQSAVGLWARLVHTTSTAAHLVNWTRRAASGSWVRAAVPVSSSAASWTPCRTWNLPHRHMHRVRRCISQRTIHTDYSHISLGHNNDILSTSSIWLYFSIFVHKQNHFLRFLTTRVSPSQQQSVVRGQPQCKISRSLAPGLWVAPQLLWAAGPGWSTCSWTVAWCVEGCWWTAPGWSPLRIVLLGKYACITVSCSCSQILILPIAFFFDLHHSSLWPLQQP